MAGICSANNCRVLTKEELSFINAKYNFWFEDDFIYVRCTNRARIARHQKNEKFSINVRHIRKITYCVTAIDMFERFQTDKMNNQHSLTDIQNAINILHITYQPIDDIHVLKVLNKNKTR